MKDTDTQGMFPDGWKIGDTCQMITKKRKGYTSSYTVQGFVGRYFLVVSSTGMLHRASPERLFHTKEEAKSLLEKINGEKGECR